MKIRRIVTGRTPEGKSVVVSDAPAPRTHDLVHVPGMSSTVLWGTAPDGAARLDGADPTPGFRWQLPGPGGTRFVIVVFPPDAVFTDSGFDPVAADMEQREVSPGLAGLFEPDNPGMHTTDTVDCIVVLDGEVWLELDDGAMTPVRRGDTVVQNGTRHAWRNLGDAPVTLAVFHVGVRQEVQPS
ncbi:cupin domain-containing protein [Streptomyces sp. NPDC059373]